MFSQLALNPDREAVRFEMTIAFQSVFRLQP